MTHIDKFLQEIKEHDEKATPGEWKLCGTKDNPVPIVSSDHPNKGYQIHNRLDVRLTEPSVYKLMKPIYCNDAAFIAFSRTALPKAGKVLDLLWHEVERLKDLVGEKDMHIVEDLQRYITKILEEE